MAFQTDVATKEAWQSDVLGAAGALLVVEVYAGWAGPCKAVKELFKKLYFEHGDGSAAGLPLKFFTASSDRVAGLEQYKGRCEPVFMFYKDGRMVEKVDGVSGPRLTELVTSLAKK